MPSPESAARGRALLAERVASAPDFVDRVPERFDALLEAGPLPRALVTTGIGTSEGHARHLAEAAARWLGQPARFATTGSLAAGAPPGSDADWLVVFSQGLSANARHALADVAGWGLVVLVTGVSIDATSDPPDAEKRRWLEDLEARGAMRIDMGCGAEYGALLRVVGARVGYAVAWSLLRTIAARRLESPAALRVEPERLREAQLRAAAEARHAFPPDVAVAPFFEASRPLLLVASGGTLELAEQLSLKIAEGMLRPQPRCVDVLHFAHGPLQSLFAAPASILYLGRKDPDAEAASWLDRLSDTLDPERHDLRVLRAELPWPFAAVELEAVFDQLVLRVLDESGSDVVDWPGADREDSLYRAGPEPDASRLAKRAERPRVAVERDRYEESVWPEIEQQLESGRRTAVLALGSVEQHGPHLPLGTDRWIAQALAEGLADRVDDGIALPALAIGCASEHLDFAGTLHVEPATLEAILVDVLCSLRRHGFERAFVFTAHGGNVDALRAMRERVSKSVAPLRLRIETDLRVGSMQADAVAAETLPPASAGPHAGEFETSLVARLRPGRVRVRQLLPGRTVEPGEAQELFYPSLRPNAESGVLGDPSSSSADRGDRYLQAWLDLLEQAYRDAFPLSTGKGRTEKNRQ